MEGDKVGDGWSGCTQHGRELTNAGTTDVHRLVELFVRVRTEQTHFTGMMVRARHEITVGRHTFSLEYQAYERIRWDFNFHNSISVFDSFNLPFSVC